MPGIYDIYDTIFDLAMSEDSDDPVEIERELDFNSPNSFGDSHANEGFFS